VKITRSARRHGISDEAIRHAAANGMRVIDTGDGLFIIGADTAGRMLELAGRPDEAGDLVVSTPCRSGPSMPRGICHEQAPQDGRTRPGAGRAPSRHLHR
jgi:hypothetical protein